MRAYSLEGPDARKLAQDTVNAFQLWLGTKQSRSKIPVGQRVIVRQLQTPTNSAKIDNSSFTAPAGVAILVVGLAFGLILLLDRRRSPRGSRCRHGGRRHGSCAYARNRCDLDACAFDLTVRSAR